MSAVIVCYWIALLYAVGFGSQGLVSATSSRYKSRPRDSKSRFNVQRDLLNQLDSQLAAPIRQDNIKNANYPPFAFVD